MTPVLEPQQPIITPASLPHLTLRKRAPELGCDSGSGDRVGCFQSQVVGAGPQVGVIIPLTSEAQGYLNLKSYWEFAAQNRPAGWNTWVTFVISPAEQTPSTAPRRILRK